MFTRAYSIKVVCAVITAILAVVSAMITGLIYSQTFSPEITGLAALIGAVSGSFILSHYVVKTRDRRFDFALLWGAFLSYYVTSVLTYITAFIVMDGLHELLSAISEFPELLPLLFVLPVAFTFLYSLPVAILGAVLCRWYWLRRCCEDPEFPPKAQ